MESILELIATGQAGVVGVLALAWWKEWREKSQLQKGLEKTGDALDTVREALRDLNTSITLLIDRADR